MTLFPSLAGPLRNILLISIQSFFPLSKQRGIPENSLFTAKFPFENDKSSLLLSCNFNPSLVIFVDEFILQRSVNILFVYLLFAITIYFSGNKVFCI